MRIFKKVLAISLLVLLGLFVSTCLGIRMTGQLNWMTLAYGIPVFLLLGIIAYAITWAISVLS
ncbi:hypothetical protein FHT21_000764 [Pedobacter sp. SG908]|nr:hypothetical protein [Pedobacter sp. SG908]NMN35723.1 hypothetical protein [Pedobacter sp. SG918]